MNTNSPAVDRLPAPVSHLICVVKGMKVYCRGDSLTILLCRIWECKWNMIYCQACFSSFSEFTWRLLHIKTCFLQNPSRLFAASPCSGTSRGERLSSPRKDRLLSETMFVTMRVCLWVRVCVRKGRLLGRSGDRQQTERQSAPAAPTLLCTEHTTRTCSSADNTSHTHIHYLHFSHTFPYLGAQPVLSHTLAYLISLTNVDFFALYYASFIAVTFQTLWESVCIKFCMN